MKRKLLPALIFISVISGGTPAIAENKNIFSFKTGSFTINNGSQTLGISPFEFETGSEDIFAFEYERLLRNNFSIGAGFLTYENDIISGSSTSSTATSIHVMATGKKYFEVTKNLLPYLGIGIGTATATIDGAGVGMALQGIAGIKLKLNRMSILVEYRSLSADVEDIDEAELDVSGTGVFGGISFNF